MSSSAWMRTATGSASRYQLGVTRKTIMKSRTTGMLSRNSANLLPTSRSTQISRGRFVERTSLDSPVMARADIPTTPLNQFHGSRPTTRKRM